MAGNGESARNTQIQQHVVLSNVFAINGKYYRVNLTSSAITWENEDDVGDNQKLPQCVSLCEVIAAIPSEAKIQGCLQVFCSKWSKKALIEESPVQVNCFQLHFATRAWKHRWKLATVVFQNTDSKLISQWTVAIQDILKGFHGRPRRLLVFVNPYGGKRKAQQIFDEKVLPLFKLAEIQADVIVTQKPDHAKETLLSSDNDICLSKMDGVICVGGDGMFNELLNGLIIRTQMDAGLDPNNPQVVFQQPKLRLGVIPGGSTDAVAFCTSGTNDPVTAALHIVLGDSLGLDVSSIHTDNRLLSFCTTMLAYGYFGDTLIESEKYRWMGPKRYDWSGVKKFLQLKHYEGEVMFKCDPDPQSSPLDSSRCYTGCKICLDAPDLIQNQIYPIDHKGWEVVRGKFVAINNATTTCACVRSKKGISPSAHIGDGCTDLILVSKCTRFNYLRYLLATAIQAMNPFNLNFVKVYRVREFQFRPIISEESAGEWRNESSQQQPFGLQPSHRGSSVWNCDGEIITEPAVCVKVHCQLVNVFARGKEDNSRPISKVEDLETVTIKM